MKVITFEQLERQYAAIQGDQERRLWLMKNWNLIQAVKQHEDEQAAMQIDKPVE